MIRMALSGAAWGLSASQTPSAFSMSTELSRERRGPRVERLRAVGQGRRTDQRHARAAMGERKRGGKTGGPGADNGNVDVYVHRFSQDLLAS